MNGRKASPEETVCMLSKYILVWLYCYRVTSPPTTISLILTVGIASETGTP